MIAHLRTMLGVVLCGVLCLGFASAGHAQNAKRVFILHSYELEHVCGGPQHVGVLRGLAEGGFTEGVNLVAMAFAMDTKRVNNTPELMRRQAEAAQEAIAAYKPDVLVTLDDNAFRMVGLAYANTDLPVVFSGLNVRPEKYAEKVPWLDTREQPGHNITGVLEKLHTLKALKVQRSILKKLDMVYVIADNSPTGEAALTQFREEMASEPHDFLWRHMVTDSWEEYQQLMLAACTDPEIDTIYPMALLLKDAKGKTYTAPEVLRWTTKVCRKPSIPINYSFVKLGVMGGVGVDFEHMGIQTGRIVARILNGEKPGDIGLQQAERYALVFNLARAKELGIVIPEDILLAADYVYSE
ncbi:hypothetical protein N1030_13070 [Desulfovibrio mangrovi]|uniref:ABC transporter substrate-binding protein n=1 Tax=Desulfovibrio mangrovi TaxID=2976983 RepID=UPI002247BC2B|nr:ABC transporter substrate binding protein [Desulfovibrio mangrovi]UZP66534.1 hypothetical protein N1030_13070 [Desulfovibrio mangrovi]